MRKRINIISERAVILIAITTFIIGYGMCSLLRIGIVQSANAQETITFQRCYALRTPSVGYDEFIEGTADKEESIQLPPGWSIAGFTTSHRGSSGRALTLVCGSDTIGG